MKPNPLKVKKLIKNVSIILDGESKDDITSALQEIINTWPEGEKSSPPKRETIAGSDSYEYSNENSKKIHKEIGDYLQGEPNLERMNALANIVCNIIGSQHPNDEGNGVGELAKFTVAVYGGLENYGYTKLFNDKNGALGRIFSLIYGAVVMDKRVPGWKTGDIITFLCTYFECAAKESRIEEAVDEVCETVKELMKRHKYMGKKNVH